MIAPYLTTMWDPTDGCANPYIFASAVYLLSCLALEFSIVVDKSVGAPGHGIDVFDGMNDRYKRMLKLEMAKLLNNGFI